MLRLTQSQVEAAERELYTNCKARFQESACVDIDCLTFEKGFRRQMNDRQNITRLRRIIKTQGCRRLPPEYHVPVLIDPNDWQNRVRLRRTEDSLPQLDVDIGYQLRAQDHENLITAARKSLGPGNRWWVVDVYVSEQTGNGTNSDALLQDNFIRSLRERFPNDRRPADGLIYQRIRYYEGHLGSPRNSLAASDWWAVLERVSGSKKGRYLKSFLKHPRLPDAFDKLLPIEGLWEGMRIGLLHKLKAMRCDEPILCYLNLIRETFLHLMGGNTNLLSLVDGVTVKLLKSRAPKISERDLKFLEVRMNPEIYDTGLETSETGAKNEQIFPDIDDLDLRRNIWERLKNIDYPIPTLETFFKDRLWLEVGQNVMQELFVPDPDPDQRVTIDEGIGGLYNVNIPMTIPYRQDRIRDELYELWRFSLQYGFEMTGPGYQRRLPRRARRNQRQPIPGLSSRQSGLDQSVLWQHLFWLAREQNFNIPIAEGISTEPAELPSVVACDYPQGSEEDVAVGRRHGKPYTDSAEADRYALSRESLAETWAVKRNTASSITAGFVRRSVFEAFFSYLKGGSSEWPTVDSTPGPGVTPVVEENMAIDESLTHIFFENDIGSAPSAAPAPSGEQFEAPTAMQFGNFKPSHINMKFFFLDQPAKERRLPFHNPSFLNSFFEKLSTKFNISNPERNNRTLPGSSCYEHYDISPFTPLHATWRYYAPTGSEEPEEVNRKRRREGGLDELNEATTWLENELRELQGNSSATNFQAPTVVEEEY
ncbi:uncharacterized protein N7446_007873 [Penicillium canescens]|uniref:Uncharacterized protein n=1 Tax=Penicillium canescens TaxID=5083 RepID=A0AAD6IM95_PENCN|nr:uncharacterized protein N7446_007873 [Penicillium canescens]KAJ6056975.1 hypothetical protein N7460_000249 [Penicillium canescens]KAJ6058290.1 hypothetical protein N7446_007873 [Penicillium canescens]